MVWYSHLFQNFPQLIVIHAVKGFGIVKKAEIDVFLELSCFFHDPADVGNLISGCSAFSKTSLDSREFTVLVYFKYCCDNHWGVYSFSNQSFLQICAYECFPGGSDGKESTCSVGDPGSSPGLGRSPGEGNGNLLQSSCLENSMDRRARQAAAQGVAKKWTQLSMQTHVA